MMTPTHPPHLTTVPHPAPTHDPLSSTPPHDPLTCLPHLQPPHPPPTHTTHVNSPLTSSPPQPPLSPHPLDFPFPFLFPTFSLSLIHHPCPIFCSPFPLLFHLLLPPLNTTHPPLHLLFPSFSPPSFCLLPSPNPSLPSSPFSLLSPITLQPNHPSVGSPVHLLPNIPSPQWLLSPSGTSRIHHLPHYPPHRISEGRIRTPGRQ